MDFHNTFRVADLANYAGNYRPDIIADHQFFQHRAQAVEDAVFDLELTFSRSQSERH